MSVACTVIKSSGGRRHQVMLRAALARVGFVAVHDGHRALGALADIENDIVTSMGPAAAAAHYEDEERSDISSNNNNNNLVILDSASGCLSSDLFADGDGCLGAALVEEVSFTLRKISRSIGVSSSRPCRCIVFVVNTISGQKAPLGAVPADIQVRLDVVQDDYPDGEQQQQQRQRQPVAGLNVSMKRTVKATLMKHYGHAVSAREGDERKSTTFAITAKGIVDEGGM